MKTIDLAKKIKDFLESESNTNIPTQFILPKNHPSNFDKNISLNIIDENLEEYSFAVMDDNGSGNPIKKFKITIKNELMIDENLENKIAKQKLYYLEKDKIYFKTISGEEVLWDETMVSVLLKEKDGVYRNICIKEFELGVLYEVIEDYTCGNNAIIVTKHK